MIPKSLTIEGLYSYKNKVIIDFNNLIKANLFGIFGLVGSGKSSILEAISFVLYGEIERLNIKDNRNYNIMNLSSNTLFIEFIFFAGKKNTEYRFVVKGKRNTKNFDKVEKYERSSYKKENNQWIPLEDITAEKIIGLSYDNFRRTIIIPQGKFNEFLNLGNADRTQMLKEIFHLEKFELFGKTKYLDIKNKEVQKEIKGALSQIKDISQELIKEQEEELIRIKDQLKISINQLSKKEKIFDELNLLKNIFIKFGENKKKFEELFIKEKDYKIKEESLNKYEMCVNNFKDILFNRKERENKIKDNEDELAENLNRSEVIENELKQKKEFFNRIKDNFNNKDKLKIKNQELNNIIKIKKVEEGIPIISKKYNEYTKINKEIEKKIINLKKEKSVLIKEINEYKKNIPDGLLLSEIKYWFEQKEEKENLIKYTKEKVKKEINDSLLMKIDFFKKLDEKEESITKILDDYKNKNKEQSVLLNNQFNELLLSQKLYNFSHNLKDGEPCPLCGSKEHPGPLKNENVQDKIESIKEKIGKIEDEYKQLEKLSIHIDKLKDNEDSLRKHLLTFKWKNYSLDDQEKINKDFNNLQNINNQIEILNKDLENIEIDIEKYQGQKENINKELLNSNLELVSARATKKTFLDGLKILNYDNFMNNSIKEIETQLNEIDKILNEIELVYNKSGNEIKKLEDEKAEIQGIIKKVQENISFDKINLEKSLSEINKRLKKYNFNNLNEILSVLNKDIDIIKEKNDILNFKKALHSAEQNFKESKDEIQNREYDEKKHKIIEKEITSLKIDINNYNQKIGGFTNSLKEMRLNLKRKNKYEKELEKLKERSVNISLLLKLFRGSGFVNYISSIYLNNLCNSANERFYKLTKQNLKLEVNEDNSLQIRDFLNNGQIRSVKTLSGGQSFQVSLSLALSLAENVRLNIDSSQNFFFIDEGFGSLDKESLQLVFNTLKTLRKENRIVGVISHLEDLKQEIDVYLEVENDPEEGSKIKSSFE